LDSDFIVKNNEALKDYLINATRGNNL
jgi:hypothetical protein